MGVRTLKGYTERNIIFGYGIPDIIKTSHKLARTGKRKPLCPEKRKINSGKAAQLR